MNDTEGHVDILVCMAGTGGTGFGTASYLRSRNPNLQVVLVQVRAVSCITNMATGIQTVKHSHARVLEIANQAGDTLCRWLGAVIQRME